MNRIPAQATAGDPAQPSGQLDLSVGPNGYITAFPYLGFSMLVNLEMNPSFGGVNMDSMVMLDCYPEIQMDLGELICPPLN